MRLIDGDGLRNEVHKAVLEVADTPMPNDYASNLAVHMGKLMLKKIDEAPTVDAEVVRHGKWEDTPIGTIKCSLCGGCYNMYKGFANYCPKCGANMDAEVEE